MQTKHGFEVVQLGEVNPEAIATQLLWNVHPPVRYGCDYENDDAPEGETAYVVTSATNVMFTGTETYIFPCTETGEILDWSELPGSFRGGLNHERAIMDLNHVGVYE